MPGKRVDRQKWYRMKNKIFFLIFILIPVFAFSFGFSKKTEDAIEAVPSPESDAQWVLGIAEPHIDPAMQSTNRLQAYAFAQELLASIIDKNILLERKEIELSGLSEHRSNTEVQKLHKNLFDQIKTRDQLIFKGMQEWKYRSELAKSIQTIKDTKKKLELEKNKEYLVGPRGKLDVHKTNKEGGFLNFSSSEPHKKYCLEQRLDGLLVLDFLARYDYILFSWELYIPWQQEAIARDSLMFSPDVQEDALYESILYILSLLQGRPLAQIQCAMADEEDFELFIDGRPMNTALDSLFIEGGYHKFDINKEGYLPISQTIFIKGGEQLILRPHLQVQKTKTVFLNMQDPQADDSSNIDIRLNGMYIGQTPLSLEIPEIEPTVLSLHKDGFADKSYLLEEDIDGHLAFSMPEILPKNKQVEYSRKRFYMAFGIFFISLPVSFFANAASSSYSEALFRTGNPIFYDPAVTSLSISYAAWTGTGLLFANTVFQLYRYLAASNNTGLIKSQRGVNKNGKK